MPLGQDPQAMSPQGLRLAIVPEKPVRQRQCPSSRPSESPPEKPVRQVQCPSSPSCLSVRVAIVPEKPVRLGSSAHHHHGGDTLPVHVHVHVHVRVASSSALAHSIRASVLGANCV